MGRHIKGWESELGPWTKEGSASSPEPGSCRHGVLSLWDGYLVSMSGVLGWVGVNRELREAAAEVEGKRRNRMRFLRVKEVGELRRLWLHQLVRKPLIRDKPSWHVKASPGK